MEGFELVASFGNIDRGRTAKLIKEGPGSGKLIKFQLTRLL